MSTTVNDRSDVQKALLGMNPAEFRAAVDQDLRPGSGPEWEARHAALRSPALVDRWYTVLTQMAKSVDGQLAAKTEEWESDRASLRALILGSRDMAEEKRYRKKLEEKKSGYSKTRAGTLRFKTGLDEALVEARFLRDRVRDRLYDSVVAEERNYYARRVEALTAAIRDHREALSAADVEPEPHDEHLWAAIDKAED